MCSKQGFPLQGQERSIKRIAMSRSNLTLSKVSDLQACLCLFLSVIVAGLATNPFFQSGVNDDWAYSQIAERFAQTGHIYYGGWTAAAVLIQTLYGALLTKLFGGSFVTHRLGTLFLSGFIPVLVYRLGLQFGLRRQMAFFGAMTLGLSPLFVPHAVSFMTDCYGCFFFLASIYAGMRSLAETKPSSAAVWFALAVLLSFAGGMNRQVCWVTGPAIVGAWCFARRKRYSSVLLGVALLAIFIFGCVLVLNWLRRQPDFQFETLTLQALVFAPGEVSVAARGYLGLFLTTLVFAIPALCAGISMLRRPWLLLTAALTFVIVFELSLRERLLVFPYLSDVVTEFGLYCPGFLLGRMPLVLPFTVRRLLTAVAFGLLFMLCFNWLRTRRKTDARFDHVSPGAKEMKAATMLIPIGSIAAYLFLLILRAKKDDIYDRYALPLSAFLILGILALCQRSGVRRPMPAAWMALTLFGVYGVAITHDHFEQMRARLRAVTALREARVPRENILAGFEADMWTQVALDGSLAWLPKSNPPIWYLKSITRVKPSYFLATSDVPRMSACKVPAVDYSTWLFPRNRQIMILCPD
jgi:hypothetical protein